MNIKLFVSVIAVSCALSSVASVAVAANGQCSGLFSRVQGGLGRRIVWVPALLLALSGLGSAEPAKSADVPNLKNAAPAIVLSQARTELDELYGRMSAWNKFSDEEYERKREAPDSEFDRLGERIASLEEESVFSALPARGYRSEVIALRGALFGLEAKHAKGFSKVWIAANARSQYQAVRKALDEDPTNRRLIFGYAAGVRALFDFSPRSLGETWIGASALDEAKHCLRLLRDLQDPTDPIVSAKTADIQTIIDAIEAEDAPSSP